MSQIVDSITDRVDFSTYDDCRAALFNRDLSRTFDRRSFEQGNIRERVVSVSHGRAHRDRRRLENTLFRRERLELYERELFPEVMNRLLRRLIVGGQADLFYLGEMLSVVLSATRAGIDHDPDSSDQLHRLVEYVNAFSQGSAIIDTVGDAERVRQLVREALRDFEDEFLAPSRRRREELLRRHDAGEIAEDELPSDVLTLLLRHRQDPRYGLDDGLIVRETATYLQGGTHTSSQTVINALHLLFPWCREHPEDWKRLSTDPLFAQRCVHETLRLRPTTPAIKRRAEADAEVGGRRIPEGSLVVLDIVAANRDPIVFGAAAADFDPHRLLPGDVARWGLSFGAGPHQCPGRNVAGGFPVVGEAQESTAGDDHLFGLVALMLQALVRLGVTPDPEREPVPDTRTERWTRWSSYPALFSDSG